mgnify:CR=1 FL=1
MTYIPKILRQQVFERANGLCEYCQASKIIIMTLQIDHIIPVQLGGETKLDNLCASCDRCNKYKKTDIQAIDPQTNTMQYLFNPRSQQWRDHFE